MTHTSSEIVSEPQIPISKLQALQFEWLARAGRLSGMATLIVDASLDIKHYDAAVAEILELDTSVDFKGANLLDLALQLAVRGDFGPGDPKVFVDILENEFSKPVTPDENSHRSMNFLTPSGRRIQFRQDIEEDGLYMLSCRDISKSYIEKHALKVALDSSKSGFIIFDVETQSFQLTGDFYKKDQKTGLAYRLVNEDLKQTLDRHFQDKRNTGRNNMG